MLIRQQVLAGIRAGSISLQFRKWRKPTVKANGTLLTRIGQLAIAAVDVVDAKKITAADARNAGYATAAALRAELAQHEQGDVYRVELSLAGEDPRHALRQQVPRGDELATLVDKVHAFDKRSKTVAWAAATMQLIARRPAVRAGDLADELGMERADFKARVRKLKALGLTESLDVGYRLSPRGKAVSEQLRRG